MAVNAAVSTVEHQHPFLSWLIEMVRPLYFVSFRSQLVHKSASAVLVPTSLSQIPAPMRSVSSAA